MNETLTDYLLSSYLRHTRDEWDPDIRYNIWSDDDELDDDGLDEDDEEDWNEEDDTSGDDDEEDDFEDDEDGGWDYW